MAALAALKPLPVTKPHPQMGLDPHQPEILFIYKDLFRCE